MSFDFNEDYRKDRLNRLSRTCSHCSLCVPDDEPLLKVFGWDDLVCESCLTDFNEGAMVPAKIDLKSTLHSLLVGEQAERLIGKIVEKHGRKK